MVSENTALSASHVTSPEPGGATNPRVEGSTLGLGPQPRGWAADPGIRAVNPGIRGGNPGIFPTAPGVYGVVPRNGGTNPVVHGVVPWNHPANPRVGGVIYAQDGADLRNLAADGRERAVIPRNGRELGWGGGERGRNDESDPGHGRVRRESSPVASQPESMRPVAKQLGYFLSDFHGSSSL